MSHLPLPSKREFELKCKEFEKSGFRWMKCLEEAAKFFGFSSYKHYRNVLKESFK